MRDDTGRVSVPGGPARDGANEDRCALGNDVAVVERMLREGSLGCLNGRDGWSTGFRPEADSVRVRPRWTSQPRWAACRQWALFMQKAGPASARR